MGGIAVTLVENGVPVTQAVGGIAVTVVDINGVPVGVLPEGDAAVGDGEPVVLTGTDGTRAFGNVTAKVTGGNLASVFLPSGSTVITSAQAVTVRDGDATTVDCSPVIQPQTGLLSYLSVPGTAALVTNGMSAKVANFGGAGSVDGIVAISGGFINWTSLANQTDVIVSNGFSTDLGAVTVSAVGDYTTANVSGGSLTNVGLALAPTKKIAVDGAAVTIENNDGSQTKAGTFSVAAGVAKAKLPQSCAIIEFGVGLQVPVSGTYTNTITPNITTEGHISSFTLS